MDLFNSRSGPMRRMSPAARFAIGVLAILAFAIGISVGNRYVSEGETFLNTRWAVWTPVERAQTCLDWTKRPEVELDLIVEGAAGRATRDDARAFLNEKCH